MPKFVRAPVLRPRMTVLGIVRERWVPTAEPTRAPAEAGCRFDPGRDAWIISTRLGDSDVDVVVPASFLCDSHSEGAIVKVCALIGDMLLEHADFLGVE